MDVAKNLKVEEVLNKGGQKEFRSAVGKLLNVNNKSRPDVCFEAKCLSMLFGKATKKDLRVALKKMQKLQGIKTTMFFPYLGPEEEWTLMGYGDAGVKSLPDKLSSCGGQVIMLVNKRKKKVCIINWKSKKIVRRVVSFLAAEALALVAVMGTCEYFMPIVLYTDTRNLSRAVHSTNQVEDDWLMVDVVAVKDALDNHTVESIRRVSAKMMLADCLTKSGASPEMLMKVLQTGEYEMPDGIPDDVPQ